MISSLIFYVVCSMVSLPLVRGHGRLTEPPSRSSMWRQGFSTPINYNDNELFCGGYGKLQELGGKCGVCGDPFDGVRENEAGGKYANGIITKQYQQGQTIQVTAEITANHKGYFEMRLCPHNNPDVPVTQDCLDQHLLQQPDGSVRFYVTPSKLGDFVFKVELPNDVTCTQCVLQWKYHTGNSYACGKDGCCVGCGIQEEFYGCSDVAILGTDQQQTTQQSRQTTTSSAQKTTSTKETTPVKQTTTSVEQTTSSPSTTTTVRTITTTSKATTTATTNPPTNDCRGVGLWAKHPFMMDWCRANCVQGFCPLDYCSPACLLLGRLGH